ncbi:hypothetical protein [Trinickia fusca]|uniref:Uncharacterized protein n=1 Tax=Trinickia fusca TaxID=2419777 RepID=A0A494XH95_9BURK|nr:hypothetical protein [Trinickia fusca]RKP46923.1 hypothetical protein D7S89_16370 [Trinickia fusca]
MRTKTTHRAGLGDVKALCVAPDNKIDEAQGLRSSSWPAAQAVAIVLLALLFAYGFLRLILVLVFPRAVPMH